MKAAATTADILNGRQPKRSIPRKWAWHYKTLLELRERLAQERRTEMTDAGEPMESHSIDTADSATDEFDHDLALAELVSTHDALFQIDAALNRIQNGGYGTCQETGRPIPASRLRAVPWTPFCKEAERSFEAKGMASVRKLANLGSIRNAPEIELAETAEDLELKEADLERPRELVERAVSMPPKPIEADREGATV